MALAVINEIRSVLICSCLLVRKELFDTLSEEQKAGLENVNVEVFEGDLHEVVADTLITMGYEPQEITRSNSTDGFLYGDTSAELTDVINEVANEHNLSQDVYFNAI